MNIYFFCDRAIGFQVLGSDESSDYLFVRMDIRKASAYLRDCRYHSRFGPPWVPRRRVQLPEAAATASCCSRPCLLLLLELIVELAHQIWATALSCAFPLIQIRARAASSFNARALCLLINEAKKKNETIWCMRPVRGGNLAKLQAKQEKSF
jgi:hypothetical protein